MDRPRLLGHSPIRFPLFPVHRSTQPAEMERQPRLNQAASLPDPGDASGFDAMFSGMSLHSLLRMEAVPEKHPSDSGGSQTEFAATIAVGSRGFVASGPRMVGGSSDYGDGRKIRPHGVNRGGLKAPKVERVEDEPSTDASKPAPFNVVSYGGTDSLYENSYSIASHLPELRSFEHVPEIVSKKRENVSFHPGESSNKHARSGSSPSESYTLDAIVRSGSHRVPRCDSVTKFPLQVAAIVPRSSLARQRRQKLSQKIQCLQRLLPWEKKMDTTTMLEEAYKYVKFLQAQVTVLQCMPCDEGGSVFGVPVAAGGVFGGGYTALGRLNRQQLLEVLVNSPVAQTMLYTQGRCVFAIEQLVLLKQAAERRAYQPQTLLDPSKLR